MSKLIDALNRLQSLKDEEPVVLSNPSESVINTVSPPFPTPEACSALVLKKVSSKKPGEEEKPLFNMAVNDWLDVLQQEYLKNFVREGGGAIKFVVFPDHDSLAECPF